MGVGTAGAATTLFDNGPYAFSSGGGMGFGSKIVADDFVLDEAATLASASLPFYHTGGEWLGPVLYWYLHTDSQGVPGSLLASGEGENIATQALGSNGYYDIFEVTFDLDQSVQLDAGVVYWLGLYNPGGLVAVGLSWGASDMSAGNTHYKVPPDGEWSPVPVEMSFQLLPEPSAELLGLTALLALGTLAVQRRRRVS
jgi:hypothetical protein